MTQWKFHEWLTSRISHLCLQQDHNSCKPSWLCVTNWKQNLTIPWRINALFSHYLLILPVDGVAVRERLLVELLTAVVVAPCWSTEQVPSTMSFRTLTSKPQLDSWSFFRSRDNIELFDSLVVEAETWWGTGEFTGCWASCLLQVKKTCLFSQENILWRDG